MNIKVYHGYTMVQPFPSYKCFFIVLEGVSLEDRFILNRDTQCIHSNINNNDINNNIWLLRWIDGNTWSVLFTQSNGDSTFQAYL